MPQGLAKNRRITRLLAIVLFGSLLAAMVTPLFSVSASRPAAVSPSLGAAASYSVLAGSAVTNGGATTLTGNLGISPGIGSPPHYTGFPPGIVGPPGVIHDADVDAAAAQAANTAAFAALIAVPNAACDVNYGAVAKELAGLTLVPGVYCANSFNLNGILTLDDTAAADGVWIFRSDLSTLATTPGVGAAVVFLNGIGLPCNVWWRVASTATIGAGTAFIGNILALTAITFGTGASLNGRALAQTAEVTLLTNQISGPTCAAAETSTPDLTSSPTSTSTSTSTATNTQVGGVTDTPTASSTPTASATNTQAPPPTNTPVPAPVSTDTPVAAATETAAAATGTAVAAATLTATAQAVGGLPATGGAPLRREGFPWVPALIAAGLFALALGMGTRAYRRRLR